MDDNDWLIQSSSKCGAGHPLWLVAEGYALCTNDQAAVYLSREWWAWKLTQPANAEGWGMYYMRTETGELVARWCRGSFETKAAALEFIAQDIKIQRMMQKEDERAGLAAI